MRYRNQTSPSCIQPCSGLILTSYFKSTSKNELEQLLPTHVVNAYRKYTNWEPFPSGIKGNLSRIDSVFKTAKKWNFVIQLLTLTCNIRLWVEKQAEICEDLFWHPHIWQNHKGQSSKICGHVVSNWRYHGTPHWILHHQWSRDYLLCCQNHYKLGHAKQK